MRSRLDPTPPTFIDRLAEAAILGVGLYILGSGAVSLVSFLAGWP